MQRGGEEFLCFFAFGKNSPRNNFIFKWKVLYQVIVWAAGITEAWSPGTRRCTVCAHMHTHSRAHTWNNMHHHVQEDEGKGRWGTKWIAYNHIIIKYKTPPSQISTSPYLFCPPSCKWPSLLCLQYLGLVAVTGSEGCDPKKLRLSILGPLSQCLKILLLHSLLTSTSQQSCL